ncbi:transposase [Oryzobacter terrae]|uniref:transposase n=1 Tax=Oryzobacter terrae TaxID=1620385 RepID=UPI0036713E23
MRMIRPRSACYCTEPIGLVSNLTWIRKGRTTSSGAGERVEVEVAWQCGQRVRSAYHQDSHFAGRAIAETIVSTLRTCPIPEVGRLGATLRRWRHEFLGYFDTDGASNGGTEAVNGLIELHRRIARGLRDRDYRLRMLRIAGGLPIPPTLVREEHQRRRPRPRRSCNGDQGTGP